MRPCWKYSLVIILIVSAATAVIWAELPHTHNLAYLAKPVPGTGDYDTNDYFWNNDLHLITAWQLSGSSYEAFTIDTVTGKALPLTALNTLNCYNIPPDGSPNGQWVMLDRSVYWGKKDNSGTSEYAAEVIRVVLSDGSRSITHKFNRHDLEGIGWLDNHHYVFYLLTQVGLAAQIHATGGELTRTIPIHDPHAILKRLSYLCPHFATVSNWHLLLYPDLCDIGESGVTLYDVDLRSQSALIQQKTVPLPKGVEIVGHDNIVPSPDGKRIAWVFQFEDRYVRQPNFWKQFWAVHIRHKARLLPVKIPTEEIWVSGIDGHGMHQIAYQESGSGSNEFPIVSLKWTPDGKALSFKRVGEGSSGDSGPIYTVPAD